MSVDTSASDARALRATLSGVRLVLRGRSALARLRQPLAVWALGVGGLFGYHFFYFVALGNAPPVDASLIAYLWPLLIVVFSALLPSERLRGLHIAGAALIVCRTVTGRRALASRAPGLPGPQRSPCDHLC